MAQTVTRAGHFIALEGIDGSGKTTQAQLLHERLERLGYVTELTCEPTGRAIGALIRRHLAEEVQLNEDAVAALFAADRLDHILNSENGILTKVNAGVTVICDRYYFSSYAYHSVTVSMDWVISLNARAASLLRPDLTILVDVPPDVGLARINSGRAGLERYERADMLEQVRDNYHEAIELLQDAERVVTVDGGLEPAAVADRIWAAVQPVLKPVQ